VYRSSSPHPHDLRLFCPSSQHLSLSLQKYITAMLIHVDSIPALGYYLFMEMTQMKNNQAEAKAIDRLIKEIQKAGGTIRVGGK